MDAKYSSESSLALSGRHLFWLLAGGLSLAAVSLDALLGQTPYAFSSLTVPLVLGMAASALAGHWAVPWLRRIKAGQYIRQDGPQSHLVKAGTPTMGGAFLIPAGLLTALGVSVAAQFDLHTHFAGKDWADLFALVGLTLSYGLVGWLDDWKILRHKSNHGISPRTKLLLQIGFGALFCLYLVLVKLPEVAIVDLPFDWRLALPPLLFIPLAWFFLVGQSNAVNLTDGLDGLAGGTTAIALLALGGIAATSSPSAGLFCAAIAGACLGFVAHNRNPAKVFMGDTGSLALGGALAAAALVSNSFWSLMVVSGLFFAETLSVILQVGYYKATKGPDGKGKRLFKMAPLHHHLELSGWTELQVVGTFYSIAAILALAAWLLR